MYNMLEGPLPSEIGLLTSNLITLEINENRISGALPSEVGLLQSLVFLNLQNNSLSGGLPVELESLVSRRTFNGNSTSIANTSSSLAYLNLEGNPLLSGNSSSVSETSLLCWTNTTFMEGDCPTFHQYSAVCGCNCAC